MSGFFFACLFYFLICGDVFASGKIEVVYDAKKITETLDMIVTSGPSRQDLEKVLVVFELDNVLVAYEDYFVRFCFEDKLVGTLKSYCALWGVAYDQDTLLSKVFKLSKTKLVDKAFIDFLSMIKRNGMKSIVVSNGVFGRYGVINDFASFRIKQVQDKGFDFSIFWAKYKSTLNKFFDGKYVKRPFFDRGFLFCNDLPVGEALTSFFCAIGWYPELIIFVGGFYESLAIVKKGIEPLYSRLNSEIVFLGFEFASRSLLNDVCDMNVINYQVSRFLQTGMWLGEDDVRRYLSLTRSDTSQFLCEKGLGRMGLNMAHSGLSK